MSTVDVNSVIVTGENSVIRLNKIDSDAFTTHASFWRILTSPAGPGDVLYLKSELTEDRWRISPPRRGSKGGGGRPCRGGFWAPRAAGPRLYRSQPRAPTGMDVGPGG